MAEKGLRVCLAGTDCGQTLESCRLLAAAARIAGVAARTSGTRPPEDAGGVTAAFLLLGAPAGQTGHAGSDILAAFDPAACLHALRFLKSGGAVFASTEPIQPLAAGLGEGQHPALLHMEAEARIFGASTCFLPCRQLASGPAAANMALLGALCASGLLPFAGGALERASAECLPANILDSCRDAMLAGAEAFAGQVSRRR